MGKQERMPKADYFRMRYANAIENGLTKKAEYYKDRLEKMGEPLQESTGKLGVTKSTFSNGLTIYSI